MELAAPLRLAAISLLLLATGTTHAQSMPSQQEMWRIIQEQQRVVSKMKPRIRKQAPHISSNCVTKVRP